MSTRLKAVPTLIIAAAIMLQLAVMPATATGGTYTIADGELILADIIADEIVLPATNSAQFAADIVLSAPIITIRGPLVADGTHSITLSSTGTVTLTGTIIAGDGGPGANGGSISISTSGTLASVSLGSGAILKGGNGGRGASSNTTGSATGGTGGEGGDITISGPSVTLNGAAYAGSGGAGGNARGSGSVTSGNGGSGGGVTVTGTAIFGGASAFPGRGGDAGLAMSLLPGTVDLQGGDAGGAGTVLFNGQPHVGTGTRPTAAASSMRTDDIGAASTQCWITEGSTGSEGLTGAGGAGGTACVKGVGNQGTTGSAAVNCGPPGQGGPGESYSSSFIRGGKGGHSYLFQGGRGGSYDISLTGGKGGTGGSISGLCIRVGGTGGQGGSVSLDTIRGGTGGDSCIGSVGSGGGGSWNRSRGAGGDGGSGTPTGATGAQGGLSGPNSVSSGGQGKTLVCT